MNIQSFADFEFWMETRPGTLHFDRWLLTGKGNNCWSSQSLRTDNLLLIRGVSGTSFAAEGRVDSDWVFFNVPDGKAPWKVTGVDLDENGIMVGEAGSDFCIAPGSADNWYSVYIHRSLLDPVVEPTAREARPINYVVQHQYERARIIRSSVRQIFSAILENPIIEASPAMDAFAEDMTSLLSPLLKIPESENRKRYSGFDDRVIPKRDILIQSREVLDAHKDRHLLVSELAKAVGASERTLRRRFIEYYGFGPRNYIFLRQLHTIRSDLRGAHPEETRVTDILTRRGVWEFGRFATSYKRYFGELPSETLRQMPKERYHAIRA